MSIPNDFVLLVAKQIFIPNTKADKDDGEDMF